VTTTIHAFTQPGFDHNVFVDLKAAYLHGHEWLEELNDYLKGNLDFFRSCLEDHFPAFTIIGFLSCWVYGMI